MVGIDWQSKKGDGDFIIDAEPILMLPPPPHSDWLLKKVAEVKRRLGILFRALKIG